MMTLWRGTIREKPCVRTKTVKGFPESPESNPQNLCTMKAHIASLIITAASSALCLAQLAGNPEDSGLLPRTPTFYVNTNYFNNGGGESPGVAIAANGNVIIGWEDDGSGIADFEAVWSLFDGNGILLTPATVITNFDGTASITNTFLSY